MTENALHAVTFVAILAIVTLLALHSLDAVAACAERDGVLIARGFETYCIPIDVLDEART